MSETAGGLYTEELVSVGVWMGESESKQPVAGLTISMATCITGKNLLSAAGTQLCNTEEKLQHTLTKSLITFSVVIGTIEQKSVPADFPPTSASVLQPAQIHHNDNYVFLWSHLHPLNKYYRKAITFSISTDISPPLI